MTTSFSKFLLSPGDAIGFCGADILSDVINLATFALPRRGISHVGIVTLHPRHGLCLAESTALATRPCMIIGRLTRGMQFQDLRLRISEYNGTAWHYPLRVPLEWEQADALNAYLLDLVRSKCPYDVIGAIDSRMTPYALIHRWKHGREDLRSLFCSELLAAAWSRYGVFKVKNASGWSPNAILRAAVRQEVVLPPYQLTV